MSLLINSIKKKLVMQTAYKVSFRPFHDFHESFPGQKHSFMHIRTFKNKEDAKKFIEEQNGCLDFPSHSVKPGYSSLDIKWVKDVEGEFITEELKYDYLNNDHIRIFSTSQYDSYYISFSFNS